MKNQHIIEHIDKTLAEIKAKGIKTTTFLEWCSNFADDSFKKLDPYQIFKGGTLDKMLNFYSQKFEPSMITEYFVGWKITERKNGKTVAGANYSTLKISNGEIKRFEYNGGFDVFVGLMFDYTKYTEYSHYNITKYPGNSEPRTLVKEQAITLNDFIGDCSRAGINLEWKQEIIERYF